MALSQAVRQFRRRLSEEGSIVRCNREFQRSSAVGSSGFDGIPSTKGTIGGVAK